MDSLITAAARALAAGDPLGALKRVALREDAPALALRGVAMAQLGDYARAKALLKRAARAFGSKEPVARARCVVAEAEVAFVSRDLGFPTKALEEARVTLEILGDPVNAAQARYLEIRRLLLIGRLDRAERLLESLDSRVLPPPLQAAHELIVAGIASRRLDAATARAGLARAAAAADRAGIPALRAEVENATLELSMPAARLVSRGTERVLQLDEVASFLSSGAFVVDACRRVVRGAKGSVSLARRPVLFAIARLLAEAWPGDASRVALISYVFRVKRGDESHRARLRVEIGRLRQALRSLATVSATAEGFRLAPRGSGEVAVLALPVEEEHAAVLALLSDGEAWSSSSLALALGASQRTAQRALDELAASGKVQSFGHGRARRWTAPPAPGFATSLLLPVPLPPD